MLTPRPPAHWLAIEQFFEAFPPPLQQQVLPLRAALLLEFSDTGLLEELLQRDFDYPWLSLHTWLLADLLPASERPVLDEPVFSAMFCTFAALYTAENIANPGRAWDRSYLDLQRALEEAAVTRLAQLFPPSDPVWQTFWDHQKACWTAARRAQQAMACAHPQPQSDTDLSNAAGRFAPASIGIAAVAFATGHAAELPDWLQWHHQLNLVHTLHRDILTIRRDIEQGRYSHPIVCTMQAAELPLHTPPNPDTLTGAMLLTGAVARLIQEGLERLDHCRKLAEKLRLPSWSAYIEDYAPVLEDLLKLFTFPPMLQAPKLPASPQRNAFASPADLVLRAVKRAEMHLLADLSFQEGWEVQRLFSPQSPEFVDRPFAMGAILECLCPHGHPLTSQVEQVFHILNDHDYAFYEGGSPWPDSDGFSTLLRLFRFSSQSAALRAMIERGLPWLSANVSPAGTVPVFWKRGTSAAAQDPPLAWGWGDHCVAITANVLVGLTDYDYLRHEALIEKISAAWVERLTHVGLGPIGYYPPPYGLWRVFFWLTRLQAQPMSAKLRAHIAQAEPALMARLARETAHPASPQTAAWLTLACLGGTARPLFDLDWITTLLKRQRYDGSWDAEPFFLTMHYSGQPFWNSSRLVTTAFCYHALQTYLRYRG